MSWVIAGLAVTVAVAAVAWAQWRTSAAATLRNASPRVSDDATRALAHITEQADRLARGEPPVGTDDPAARAAMDGLYRVSERFQQMTDARVHIVATERDLDRARAMYRSILPLSSVAKHGRIHIAGASMPAAETGGDWWTYRKLTGGRLMVVVGDATGHGVYSAMIGCAAHGAVEALSHVGEERLTPTSVLRAINAAIRIPGADRAAMTCFAALIDPKAGTIDFANASHMLPLLATTDETGTVIKVNALTTGGDKIDRVDDSELIVPDIREGSQKLAPGEVVVMFTDGLTDRRDKGGRAFGHRRLQQALGLTKLAPGGEAGITAVRDRVLAEVATFADGVPSDDDVTLVVCALDR
jgi:sigma-B regulation protein RsbU (phosphoserine phosphatase)